MKWFVAVQPRDQGVGEISTGSEVASVSYGASVNALSRSGDHWSAGRAGGTWPLPHGIVRSRQQNQSEGSRL